MTLEEIKNALKKEEEKCKQISIPLIEASEKIFHNAEDVEKVNSFCSFIHSTQQQQFHDEFETEVKATFERIREATNKREAELMKTSQQMRKRGVVD